MMCLGVGLFGVIFLGTLCSSYTWISFTLLRFRDLSTIISSNIFAVSVFFSLSNTSIMQMLVHLMLS